MAQQLQVMNPQHRQMAQQLQVVKRLQLLNLNQQV
jgi:hypothetical protein